MSGLSRVTVEVRNGDIAKALKKFKKKVLTRNWGFENGVASAADNAAGPG